MNNFIGPDPGSLSVKDHFKNPVDALVREEYGVSRIGERLRAENPVGDVSA